MVFIINNMIMKLLQSIGATFLDFLSLTGNFVIFVFNSVVSIFLRPIYFKNILKQMLEIGYYSLPVVGLTAIFTGAVLALQSYSGFTRFSAEGAIPMVVALSVTRELGPVLAGLMVAGRIGASIAAEIATMRVTEQIDALKTLSTCPIRYLVVPRLIAAILMMPCLVIIADIIGIMGGYLVSVYSLNFNPGSYLDNTIKHLEYMDVMSGLVKSGAFGFIIAIVGCYFGYNSDKGAQGVGKATTNAVVLSSILILLTNYFMTQIFFT